MPRKVTITSEEIREAMKEPFEAIVKAIKETLEETPPELAADLTERGITMAGGGSLIRGIDRAIRKEIDVPVRLAEDPLTCVARGTGLVIENLDKFKDALESDVRGGDYVATDGLLPQGAPDDHLGQSRRAAGPDRPEHARRRLEPPAGRHRFRRLGSAAETRRRDPRRTARGPRRPPHFRVGTGSARFRRL